MTEQEPALTVAIEETNAPVEAGESLVVTVTVENTGEDGEGTVELYGFDEDAVDSADVELEVGETDTVELEWETDGEAVGTGELRVETDHDTATEDVTIEDKPATFDVEVERVSEYVSEGGTVTAVVAVENTGTLEGTQDVTITINETPVRTEAVTLAGGDRETIEVTYTLEDGDIPDVDVSVESDDDSASDSVPVVQTMVSKLNPIESKGGMGFVGWVVFLGMLILFLPLIPFYILYRVLDALFSKDDTSARGTMR